MKVREIGVPVTGWTIDADRGIVCSIRAGTFTAAMACWGCEAGNWHGQFSHHDFGGPECDVLASRIRADGQSLSTRFDFALPGARLRISTSDTLVSGTILRRAALEALDDSLVGDFVLRHALPAAVWPVALLEGEPLRHLAANRMTLRPACEATCAGATISLRSSILDMVGNPGFERVTYARDEAPATWVIHHRFIASREAADLFALRFRHFIRHVRPGGLQGLLAAGPLFRFSERHGWMRPTVQTMALIRMSRGQRLDVATRLSLFRLDDCE